MGAPGPMPTDTPLLKVIRAFEDEGFRGQLRAEEGGLIRCLTCRQVADAHRVHADRVTRLEGVSDPADMLIVVPVTCTVCGTPGLLIANYGPESSPEEAEVLRHLERRPMEGSPGGGPVGATDPGYAPDPQMDPGPPDRA